MTMRKRANDVHEKVKVKGDEKAMQIIRRSIMMRERVNDLQVNVKVDEKAMQIRRT